MPPRMNRRTWFAYRHPFLAAGLAAAGMLGVARLYGNPTTWGVVAAVLVAVSVLVMWWPRHGVLTGRVNAWLDDDDPRVVKPHDPRSP